MTSIGRQAAAKINNNNNSSSSSSKMTIDQQKIRARLLNKLGIYQEISPVNDNAADRRLRLLRAHGLGPMTPMATVSPPDGSAVHRLLDNVVPFEVDLVYKRNYVRSSAVTSAPTKPAKIRFRERVSVVPIPSRHEYSNRIKSRIWTNRYELSELQERNVIEFAAEGWNWHDVVEDDQMFLDAVSGEMVHPIHIQMLQEQERHRQMMNDVDKQSMTHDVTSVCEYVP